jgi:hypothetical protein
MTMPVKLTDRERRELYAQQARARDLPDNFLDCRSLGHAWTQCAPDRKPQFGELQVFQCQRCLSIRDDLVSAKYGELLSRGYRPAPGYQIPKPEDGTKTFSAAALRAERRRRMAERELPFVVDWNVPEQEPSTIPATHRNRPHRPTKTKNGAPK